MEVKLSPWQTTVWDDPHRFKVVNVGRRSGKTVMSVIRMIYEASLKNGQRIWYCSPTYRQSKQIAWSLLKQFVPPAAKPQFNETELVCTFNNGSTISLKGADNPESLRGTYLDFLIMDEVSFFKDWQTTWDAMRPLLSDHSAPAWFISTPNGLNHFYDLYQKQIGDADYVSYHYTSYDNPYIPKEEIDKAKQEMDEDSFNQEYMAEFVRPKGAVYKEWNLDHFTTVPYDQYLPLHISFDWGINDPTSVIWIQPQGSDTRVIDYYEASNADIGHFISVINSKTYKTPELYTGDPAGKARTLTTGTSVIEILAQKGINVRTLDGVKIPEQIRITHTKIPGLYVDNKLVRFRDCLLNYRYPDKNSTIINQENEVPIHNEFSHAMRAFEYWAVNSQSLPVDPHHSYPTYDKAKWTLR